MLTDTNTQETTQEEVTEESTETTEPKEGETKPVDKPNEVVDLLKNIDQKLTKEAPQGPTPEQMRQARREQLKERFGWNDEQVTAYEQDQNASLVNAVAPLQEKLAWSELKTEVGGLTPDIEKEMKDELSQYPAPMRGDKTLMEKVYYMALGKKQRFSAPAPQPKPAAQSGQEDTVISRRVVTGSPAVSMGTNSSSSKAVKISDEEKVFARKMRMTDEEYARYRENDAIESFKQK